MLLRPRAEVGSGRSTARPCRDHRPPGYSRADAALDPASWSAHTAAATRAVQTPAEPHSLDAHANSQITRFPLLGRLPARTLLSGGLKLVSRLPGYGRRRRSLPP